MKEYTYHKDLRRLISSVGKLLDGIVIRRYTKEGGGGVVDDIAVPVKYAPKSRVLHALTNLSNHIQLPILSYQLKGVKYDENRAFNKIGGFTLPSKMDKTGSTYPQPVPVNLSFSTSFLSRFEGDAEQFISCLYSQFYQYTVVSYEFPELGTQIRSKFIWGGDATTTYPDELDVTKPYRCEVTSDFTLEGWIFKNIERKNARIYNIPISFETVPEIQSVQEMNEWRRYSLADQYETLLPKDAKFETKEVAPNTDFITVSGRAWVRDCHPSTILSGDEMKVVQLKGNMFETTSAVVLTDVSGHPFVDSQYNNYDFYSKDKTLSAFGSVSGVSVPYEVLDDHTMLVQIPDYANTGIIDIKILGEFGIGDLMNDSKREYIAYAEGETSATGTAPVPPTVSGIKLLGDR